MAEGVEPAEAPADDESAITDFFGADEVGDRLADLFVWLQGQLSSVDVIVQLSVVLLALAPAAIFGPHLRRLIISRAASHAPEGAVRRAADAFAHIATPIALYAVWQGAALALAAMNRGHSLINASVSLLSAWIVIRLVSLVIRSPFWSQVAFYFAWPIAALDATGLLDDSMRMLDRVSIGLGGAAGGETSFSLLDVIRVVLIFVSLFWISRLVNRFLKNRLAAVDELTPSMKTLLQKIFDVVLPIAAFFVALQVVGFNFAALAIFGGAVGLGIGLGLQRSISNFFAGFMLIADKSIKPGDVIEVGSTFGWVAEMNARYVTIRTRDGKSHLMPNDRLIEEGVVNWSHSGRTVRLHAGFGVSYSTSDLRAVIKAAENAASAVPRVLSSPAPRCNLVRFGDSSVDFDLRFWINDPANGVANVTSDVMLAIWDRLREMRVEIPFPQRDVHIRSAPASFDLGGPRQS